MIRTMIDRAAMSILNRPTPGSLTVGGAVGGGVDVELLKSVLARAGVGVAV
ncbi:MAG: hypothetical protein J07HQX50_01610, partial [Haloquadratum sp. J07HQX50]